VFDILISDKDVRNEYGTLEKQTTRGTGEAMGSNGKILDTRSKKDEARYCACMALAEIISESPITSASGSARSDNDPQASASLHPEHHIMQQVLSSFSSHFPPLSSYTSKLRLQVVPASSF